VKGTGGDGLVVAVAVAVCGVVLRSLRFMQLILGNSRIVRGTLQNVQLIGDDMG